MPYLTQKSFVVGDKPLQERMITRLAKTVSKEVIPSAFVGAFVGFLQNAGHHPNAVSTGIGIATGTFIARSFFAVWKEHKKNKNASMSVANESTLKPKM